MPNFGFQNYNYRPASNLAYASPSTHAGRGAYAFSPVSCSVLFPDEPNSLESLDILLESRADAQLNFCFVFCAWDSDLSSTVENVLDVSTAGYPKSTNKTNPLGEEQVNCTKSASKAFSRSTSKAVRVFLSPLGKQGCQLQRRSALS